MTTTTTTTISSSLPHRRTNRILQALGILVLGATSIAVYLGFAMFVGFCSSRCGEPNPVDVVRARWLIGGGTLGLVGPWVLAAVRWPHRASVTLCTVAATLVGLFVFAVMMPSSSYADGLCF